MSLSLLIFLILAGLVGLATLRWRFEQRMTPVLVLIAATTMFVAAYEPRFVIDQPAIALVIDRSPSTRTADFRNASIIGPWLVRASRSHDITLLDLDGSAIGSLNQLATDVPTRTWTPPTDPGFDRVLLFTDGRLEVPLNGSTADGLAVPIDTASDQQLTPARDARVRQMLRTAAGGVIRLSNDRSTSQFDVTFATPGQTRSATVSPRIDVEVSPDQSLTVTLPPGDAWPENDAMTLPADVHQFSLGWLGVDPPCVTTPIASTPIRTTPVSSSTDLASLMGLSAIVIDDPDFSNLPASTQDALARFATDVGGSVVLTLGSTATRTFARDSMLAQLSPISLDPPQPRSKWVVLVDSSGSMSQTDTDKSHFQFAVDAVRELVRGLPGEDIVRLGVFSRDLVWLGGASPARLITEPKFTGVRVGGPTNLDAALTRAVETIQPSDFPTQLVVVTDAAASIESVGLLQAQFRQKQVRLWLLTRQPLTFDHPLVALSTLSGGAVVTDADFTRAVRQLGQAGRDRSIDHRPVTVRLTSWLASVGEITLTDRPARAWPRQGNTPLCDEAQDQIGVVSTQRGLGQVIAIAGRPSTGDLLRLASALPTGKTNPDFQLRLTSDHRVQLATTRRDIIPDLKVNLRGSDFNQTVSLEPQGPGLYCTQPLTQAHPAMLATAILDGQPVARLAVTSMPDAEFRDIGTDPDRISFIAHQHGGQYVGPWQTLNPDQLLPKRYVPPPKWLWVISCMICIGLALSAHLRRSA